MWKGEGEENNRASKQVKQIIFHALVLTELTADIEASCGEKKTLANVTNRY